MDDNYSFEDLIKISKNINDGYDNIKIIELNNIYNNEYLDYSLNKIDNCYNKKTFNDSLLYFFFGMTYGISLIGGSMVFIYKLIYY